MKIRQTRVPDSCTKHGEFKLRSGGTSNVYYDFKDIAVNGRKRSAMNQAAHIVNLITNQRNMLAGEGVGVLSMLGYLCRSLRMEGLLLRAEVKEHGQQQSIEGDVELAKSRGVYLIQDVMTTTEGSTTTALKILDEAGIKAKGVIVLLDRRTEDRGAPVMDVPVHSVFMVPDEANS
jgi:orotate phosphoribosyltransferase